MVRRDHEIHHREVPSIARISFLEQYNLGVAISKMLRAYDTDMLSTEVYATDFLYREKPGAKIIPPRYWSDPIKYLRPVYIYRDQGNTVIVQVITNGFEYGLYYCPPHSSHMPSVDFIISERFGAFSEYRKQLSLKQN